MPPPDSTPVYHVLTHPSTLYLYQIEKDAELPRSLLQPLTTSTPALTFKSITWTTEEISIVTDIAPSAFPELNSGTPQSLVKEGEQGVQYLGLRIKGPMDLSLTGILHSLISPLKEASIPIFTIATWNTDYLLVPLSQKDKAFDVLRRDGWTVLDMVDI